MNLNIFIDLLFVITSLYISILTIRTYIFAKENHSAALYWGSSFALLSIMYFTYLISDCFNIYSFKLCLALHILQSFLFMNQFKVAIQLYIATRLPKKSNIILRVIKISYSIIFPLILAHLIMNIQLPNEINNVIGLFGLQILGIFKLDIMFEIFYIILILLIFFILPWRYYFLHLQIGFFLLALSKIVQVIHIIQYQYTYSIYHQIEWSLMIVSMILFTIGIHNLYNKKVIKYRELDEKNLTDIE